MSINPAVENSKRQRSLFWQILRWTLVALLLLAAFAGAFSYWSSYHESSAFQQENLKNIAALIINHDDINKSNDTSALTTPSHRYYKTNNEEGGLSIDVWLIPLNKPLAQVTPHITESNLTPQALPWQTLQTIPKGLSSHVIDDTPWQIYRLDVIDTQHGLSKTVVVRQNSDLLQELSQNSAMQSALPLVLAMLIFFGLLTFIMWRTFRPVENLAHTINQRAPYDLSPLTLDELPSEILPFGNAINELLIKVKNNVETQQRFITDASHELRSPLTATSLQLQRIQRIVTEEKIAVELKKLSLRIKRNQDLVEQLLTLARLNAEQSIATKTSLVPLIEQNINLLLPIIDHKKIELNLTIAPNLQSLQMMVDGTAILLLIKNLLQNAVLYTPAQGKITVNLTNMDHCSAFIQSHSECVIGNTDKKLSEFANKQPILQIIDTGMGIEPSKYQQVFEPFVRLTSIDSQTSTAPVIGTGLGLAMVKSICEQTGIQLFLSPTIPIENLDQNNQTHIHQINLNKNQGLCVTLVLPNQLLIPIKNT